MSIKHSPIYSILNNKCPHCHEGNFWKTSNPYDLKQFSKMNEYCLVCNEDFRKEPGYYFGATYVSYALTVAFGIVLYAVLGWYFNMDTIPFLLTFSILLIVLLPIFYRYARLIWIHLFVKYKK
jgi:uncharacterized protein (DUF983 family)